MQIELTCSMSNEKIFANIRENVSLCSDWLGEVPAHEGHAVIVGGGPSVADNLDKIKWRISLGQTVFALNGACRFLNRHGITPDYQVFLDGNPDLKDRIGDAKEYLVGSQCDPSTTKAVPHAVLWHLMVPGILEHIPKRVDTLLIGGGTTVGLSTMCLVYGIGYRKLHLFGYDSSSRDGRDHAYEAPVSEEFVGGQVIGPVPVKYGDKEFLSTLSMIRQAEIFPTVCNNLIDLGCIITVDGDGLIKAVMDDVRCNAAQAA